MQMPTILWKIRSRACALVSRFKKLLQYVARRPRSMTPTAQATPQQPSEGVMLVESDVKKGIRGILP